MRSFIAILALPAVSFAMILPRQNATLSCDLATLQCCGSLDLASEPAVANTLGLEGLPIPGADVTVGFNCTSVPADDEPVTASCLGILSCCNSVGLGTDASISEGCLMAGINPTKRDVIIAAEADVDANVGLMAKVRSFIGM